MAVAGLDDEHITLKANGGGPNQRTGSMPLAWSWTRRLCLPTSPLRGPVRPDELIITQGNAVTV